MINLDKFSSFFVANWKLNGDFKFIDDFVNHLQIEKDSHQCVVICPTSVHLEYMVGKKNIFYVGAQNVSHHINGAFTGEISSNSLSELGVDFCIIGHSERRQIFNESNHDVSMKAYQLIKNSIVPIICIGETLKEKENGKTKEILAEQLSNSIPEISNSTNTIIAYEPVWAIGTGLTPTLKEINETHEFIKNNDKKFKNYKILYGGSVKAINSKEITNLANVDGALIGGASLKSDEFTEIIKD